MYVRKAGTFILGASIILWFLNTYPRPEEDTAPTNAAAMEHSYAGQIGHWMEPVTQVAGFDWKINSALVGAFAAKKFSSPRWVSFMRWKTEIRARLPSRH